MADGIDGVPRRFALDLTPVIPSLIEGQYLMPVADIIPVGKLRKAPKVGKAVWKLGEKGARWGWGKAKKLGSWVRGGRRSRGRGGDSA